MSIEENKEIVRAFISDVVNGEHPERIADYAGAEFVLHFPGEPPYGLDEVPQFQSRLRTAFPDFHVRIEDLIGEDDKVVVLTTVSGTHRGIYQGEAPTGKTFQVSGQVLYRLRQGKIVEARPVFDRLAILDQVGTSAQRRAA